ncbi:MAG TPA: glycosyltransferase family 9 protein [Candidatus Saccharimonadales bacterium]|nr:glycosyltransferase family 9 protein [Candidatus Saccharimonadales bacterium]
MNVAALQKMDRWAGVPLCFCLTLFRKVFTASLPPGPVSVRSILFVKLAEQGSTVLAIDALVRAVEMVGRENVYFIAFAENRFILDLLELIPEENVITLSSKSVSELVSSSWEAMGRMRKLKLDAAIDMEFFARGSAALTFLSGARARVGFHSFFSDGPYRGDLMTHRLLYNPHLHTSAMFQVLVESLACDPARLPTLDFLPPSSGKAAFSFAARPDEIAPVRAWLPAGQPLLLLNPNASDLLPLRQWPNVRYVDLARRLLAEFPEVCIGFTGAPGEAQEIERLAREVNSPSCFSLAGKTTLRQLMVLYTLAEILVTNDSGPAHFASLTPVHVITLFGPETPALFAARTSRNVAIWRGIACSPCVSAYNNRQSPCRDNVCMQQITVEQVFAEASLAYKARRDRIL